MGTEAVRVRVRVGPSPSPNPNPNPNQVGMPHRGRLNVLANVARKPLEQIFREFRGGVHGTAVG